MSKRKEYDEVLRRDAAAAAGSLPDVNGMYAEAAKQQERIDCLEFTLQSAKTLLSKQRLEMEAMWNLIETGGLEHNKHYMHHIDGWAEEIRAMLSGMKKFGGTRE